MTKLKEKYFKWNTKMNHGNNKWYLVLLLKMISQIQFFLFDYFHPIYYHVLPLGHVHVKVYFNHYVK